MIYHAPTRYLTKLYYTCKDALTEELYLFQIKA